MKIAIIVHRLTFKGGTQRQALELAQELKKLGHWVKLYTFEYDPAETYTDLTKGLEVIVLKNYDPKYVEPFFGFFIRPSYLAWWFKRNRAARQLAHMIDQDTDVLNPHAFYVYAVSRYFKKEIRDIPSIWMLNTMTLRGWKFWRAKELDPSFRVSSLKRFFYRIMDFFEWFLFIRNQKITVLNKINQEYVRTWMGKEAVMVTLGGNAASFPYVPRHGIAGKNIALLCVGALFPHRRFEDAIEAVKMLVGLGYDPVLSIIGTQTDKLYYEMLQRLVRDRGLEKRVVFCGTVSEEELRRLYRESDIGLFPSILHPGNLATFELMATGTPVVVSRGAATSALLTDRENAILVDPYASEEIRDAVLRLASDAKFYDALSRQGRKFVEEKITWARYARDMVCEFENALRNR